MQTGPQLIMQLLTMQTVVQQRRLVSQNKLASHLRWQMQSPRPVTPLAVGVMELQFMVQVQLITYRLHQSH